MQKQVVYSDNKNRSCFNKSIMNLSKLIDNNLEYWLDANKISLNVKILTERSFEGVATLKPHMKIFTPL